MFGMRVSEGVVVLKKPGKLQEDTIANERSIANKKMIFIFKIRS